jgi:acetoacetyl-CoA reductase
MYLQKYDLKGRSAVVTGGGRAIGLACVEALAEAGAKVIIADYDEKVAAEGQAEMKAKGYDVDTVRMDVTKPDDVRAVAGELGRRHGGVDILVNNAGVTRDGTMKRMSRQAWEDVIDINLGGCFNMAKAVWEGMNARKYGRIVNIGSINGQAGQYGQVNYAAAKSGIHGFTKALAQEGARAGITVNAIAPGYIDTDMVAAVPPDVMEKIVAKIPVGRLGQASEIARGVTFLCAEEGGFITGSTLSINGGQHMY